MTSREERTLWEQAVRVLKQNHVNNPGAGQTSSEVRKKVASRMSEKCEPGVYRAGPQRL
jgi:hypothetical protein